MTIFPVEYKRPSPVPIAAVFPKRMAFARADELSMLILLLFKRTSGVTPACAEPEI